MDVHVSGGLATKQNLCQNSNHNTLPKSKKVCHVDGISMSMIFAPDIPHSRPPGRDVGTGQTVSRVPLSRVMVPEPFTKFVHRLFAVCLWEICVLAATGSSLWLAVIMKVHQDLAFSM